MNNDLLNKIKSLSPSALTQLEQFVDYLRWQEQAPAAGPAVIDWRFDFVEKFAGANTSPQGEQHGAEIKIGPAVCGGVEKAAIYAHPPVEGQSAVEYFVPVPQDITTLRLHLAIGIRDGSELADGNLVAFSVRLNGYQVWGTQTQAQRWQEYDIPLRLRAGDINQLTLTTEALGGHQWTWAVWGAPVLVGSKS
jgi:hypothetical protein